MFQSLHCQLVGTFIPPAQIPTYLNLLFQEIETDANGISTASLRSKLENWPAGKHRPKILYTVPVRRKLAICNGSSL
jgi:DNA-binding transcriptional MocR family regulator